MRGRNRDETRRLVLKGLRDGLPIGLGYFAVAFSLGILLKGMKRAGESTNGT